MTANVPVIRDWDGKSGILEDGNVAIRIWDEVAVVKVSDVGKDFKNWLQGQTIPNVMDDKNPYDWAYYGDYIRWKAGLPIVD